MTAVSTLAVLCATLQLATTGPAAADDPAPVLGGQLYSTGAPVTVEVLSASAGFTSTLFLLEPEEVRIASNRDIGTKVTVGPYGAGEELVFGIRVNGSEFKMGPGTRNPDGLEHAVVDFDAQGCAVVGFEDLFGGGDRDYDDNRFKFCGGIAPDPQEPPNPPEPNPFEPPTADAGADQAVDEGSLVTLDASGSHASTLPALEASEKQGTLPGGTSIGASVAGLDPDATGALTMDAKVDIGQGPQLQNTSLAYVIDISGSADYTGGCGGDANRDGKANRILDCEVAAALELNQSVIAAGTVEKVAVIKFSSGASAVDLDPTTGTSTLVSPTADKDNNGVPDVEQALRALRVGGGTNFAAATRTTCSLLGTTGSSKKLAAFLSDGQATEGGGLSTIVPCAPPVVFQTFAVGLNSKCTLGATGARLIDLATLSGGACTNVPDIGDLPNILPSVIGSRLTKVEYTVDGGAPVDVSADAALPVDGPADVPLSIALPAGLDAGTHTICLTATGEDAGGSSSVTTCSDLVAVNGQLSYRWRQVSATGPSVFLTSRTSATPSFVAADDGVYVFELTVTDGSGATDTDRVQVTVRNVAPVLHVEHGASYAGGVTQVDGSFTDVGWLDTHHATIDWGDGSTDRVDVSAQGSGWGTFFGSHVFTKAGTYSVHVVLLDDDGGLDENDLTGFEVQTPVAVWANSTSLKASLDWSGASGSIQGRVHTNGLLRFVGAPKSVVGETTYAGALSADTDKFSFVPAPAKTGVKDFPVRYDVADYRPGGPVAVEVGSAYHDMSDACSSGSWHDVQSALASGVYYASCDIKLNGDQIGGRVTLVSEGRIAISGARPAFQPYRDGLLFLAGSSADKAIDIAASTSKFLGVLFAGTGEIDISGSSNRFFCGILGDRVDISGGGTTVRGAMCGRPDSTVSGPLLIPDLHAALTVDRATALPSQRLTYGVRVSNDGTTLVVPSLIGFENVDTTAATVDGYTFSLERFDVASGSWVPFATVGDPGFRVDVRPNAAAGVTYPDSGGVAGTTAAPGGWATWGLMAVLDLTPTQISTLLDPARTAGVRTRADFDLSPSGLQARRLYTFGSDFSAALRSLSADVTEADATLLVPEGDARSFDGTTNPSLATLHPGDAADLQGEWTVPVPAKRGTGETDAGYLSRLLTLNRAPLNAATFVLAKGGVGRLVAPVTKVDTTEHLPVVGISTTGADTVPAGSSADYAFKLANLGSATAIPVDVKATAGTTDLAVTGTPSGLAAGELGQASASYTAPAASTGGPLPVRGQATWSDELGNAYGATGSTLDVQELAPAKLVATLTDALHTDVAGDSVVSPGDTVRYTLTLKNTGGTTVPAAHVAVPLDQSSTLVSDSPSTGSGGTVTRADTVVEADLGSITGAGQKTLTFDVVVADPFPKGVSRIQAQGTVTAEGLDAVLTDDPALPGAADPTRTGVTSPRPAMASSLTGQLAVDADNSGDVTPGDTLAYQVTVDSVGTQDVTGVRVQVSPPDGTSVVPGSVTTSAGTVAGTSPVDVAVGTLAPFASAQVGFRLLVANPLPAGVTAISLSGTVTSNELDPLQTDDPATFTIGDATSIPIGGAAGNPERPGPTVDGLSVAEGTVLTAPEHLTATLAPPSGATVSGWTVSYHAVGDVTSVQVAEGTNAGVDAVIDPTRMPNGTYVVTVRAESSDGGVTVSSVTVVVDGQAKLGRYVTTINDLTVGVAGMPIRIGRTYDSFDKSVGDFGVGWNLQVSSFHVSTNGPLGDGGWKMQACDSGMIFVPLCFSSSRPHFVTVTWPDGRNEIFDLTPAQGSTFFSGLTSAGFTGRPGTTSKLTAVESDLFYSNGNLLGGAFGSDGIYNPTQFRLTDRFGTEYLLDTTRGLQRVEDRAGAVTTFSKDGITSSLGKSVTFDRDSLGRIKKVTAPDGSTVGYGYDGSGDLVKVTDQEGHVTELGYLPGHYLEHVDGPDQKRIATYEYTDGRLTAVIDGEGNRVAVESDPTKRQQTVTDPGGKRTTISTFDEDGLLVRTNEVYGGADHVTVYGYDENRNLNYRKDPMGHEWRATYSGTDLTSFTDATGDTTAATYNEHGQPLTWTVPGGGTTKYTWNPDGSLDHVVDALNHSESYTYYPNGLRKTRTDRNGKTWSWTYTPAGLVETETDPLGHKTTFEYNDNGLLTGVVDAKGNRTTTTYDSVGNVTDETNADGATTHSEYDGLNRLVQTKDPSGAVVDYGYDDAGRLAKVDNHLDAPTVFGYDGTGRQTSAKQGDLPASLTTYDGAGNVLTRTDPLGRTTRYTYDASGREETRENPAGGVTRTTYNADGQVSTTTDPDGGVTRYQYAPDGRTAQVTDPTGVTVQTKYDALGRVWRTVYDDGTVSERHYDFVGNMVETVDQEGFVTKFGYDDAGRRIGETDPEGRHAEYTLDELGRVTTVTGPDGGITQNTWSPGGLLTSTTTPEGVTTSYEYDPRGLLTKTTDELGHVTSTSYDAAGRELTQRDPREQSTTRPTSGYGYDPYGRLASITDVTGAVVSFGYDDAGQRTKVIDPRGKLWKVDYDALGNPEKTTDPLGRSELSTYDKAGRLSTRTDARGTAVDYGYDDAGRLASMTEQGGPGSVGFTYDALGRRETMTDATGTTTWSYFPDNEVKGIEAPAGTVSYTYDKSNRRASMTQPKGTVGYAYDAAGRLKSLTDWAGRVTTTTFDKDARLVSALRPNGVQTDWSYDPASRLTKVSHSRGGTVVDYADYGLDADGNRTSMRSPSGTESYTINPLDQLTGVSYPDGTTQSYTYDEAGNRVTARTGSGPVTTYEYDDAEQLVAVGGSPVRHDADGNVVESGGATYDWDWLSRLTGVTTGGASTTYGYDGDGVRVTRTQGGAAATPLLYDRADGSGLPQLVSDGGTDFLRFPAGVLEEAGSSDVGFPLTDALGSVRAMTDASGALSGRTTYDAFGGVRSTMGTSSASGFTGAPQTGDLVHLNDRDLSTSTGRFLSVDPVRPGAPGVVGWNPYTYVANDPTTLTDPSGRAAAVEGGELLGSLQRYAPAMLLLGGALAGMYASLPLVECLASGACVPTVDPPWTNNGPGTSAPSTPAATAAQLASGYLAAGMAKGLSRAMAATAAATCLAASLEQYTGWQGSPCESGKIFFQGTDMPDHYKHMVGALAVHPWWTSLHLQRPGADRGWLDDERDCVMARVQGKNCDEFPFATTQEGGELAVPKPSVFGVDKGESAKQGGLLRGFYNSPGCQPFSNGDQFFVVPVAIPVTFYFCGKV